MRSPKYDAIKRYYDMKMPNYTDEGIKIFVRAGWLTPEEYGLITDIEYVYIK